MAKATKKTKEVIIEEPNAEENVQHSDRDVTVEKKLVSLFFIRCMETRNYPIIW